ncbi:MAG: SdpI family protein [Ruminococcus sp.]|nr:SdpI family protein [Ruminococcus sp.]
MILIYILCIMPVPFIMIGAGWFLKKYPPSDINKAYGYRTKRAMKSLKAWKFAQENCARIWIKTGKLMILPSAVMCVVCCLVSEFAMTIILSIVPILQIAVMLIVIIPMEKQLKAKFDENGDEII